MRRRNLAEGATARARLAEWDRSIAIVYGGSLPEWAAGLRATAAALDAGEQVGPIPGYELDAWVRGIDPHAVYLLTADDVVLPLVPDERQGQVIR